MTPTLSSETIHASCVALGAGDAARAVLLAGRSGAGKSDLALRLIDRGAVLVSDDYTLVTRADRRGSGLVATAPPTIAGKLEIRGLGIVALPHLDRCPVALLVDLDEAPVRMPEPHETRPLAGVALPFLRLAAFEASAPIKVERALARLLAGR